MTDAAVFSPTQARSRRRYDCMINNVSSTAPALLTKAASFRVEWYRIISPPLGTAFFRFVHKF